MFPCSCAVAAECVAPEQLCSPHCQLFLQRWNHHLRPDIKREAWTADEEAQLVEAHKQLGNKWSDIARLLPGKLLVLFGASQMSSIALLVVMFR